MHVNIAARCIKLTYMTTRTTKERSFTNIFLRGEVEEEEEEEEEESEHNKMHSYIMLVMYACEYCTLHVNIEYCDYACEYCN